MGEIVRKLEARVAPPGERGVPSSLQPTQDRELRIRVEAETLEKMNKVARTTLELPVGSSWEILCDEGAYLDGDDEAPPLLVYFATAIAF